ncbi:class I SAM-dependent methyltransferase [Bacteroidota bacterium]
MRKQDVIQKIIDRVKAKTYLEIGVQKGKIIGEIKAPYKVGVDPRFTFTAKVLIKKIFGLTRFKAFEKTSNYFFENYADNLLSEGIDVVFVDGLHTYNQSLKDVNNCMKYLNEGGVIILHDCNPLNYAGAYPVKESFDEVLEAAAKGDLPGWNGRWNGDTWKALVHLRIEHSELNIFTLDLHWGMGIITRGSGIQLKNISVEDLERADYSFLEKDRVNLLNLKPPKYLYEFLEEYK